MTDILYLTIAGAGLLALCGVLVVIGRAAADCPQTAGAARLATWVVTTGFAALGVGAIGLVGAVLPVLARAPESALYAAIGIVSVLLGLGFSYAATQLREILDAAQRARTEAPAASAA